MVSIDNIASVVASEFADFKVELRTAVLSSRETLAPISNYILTPSGKHVRPLLCLLTAQLHAPVVSAAFGGSTSSFPSSSSSSSSSYDRWTAAQRDAVFAAAVMMEMIHWSTLVHDDVVDEAYRRRDQWTPSALLRSKSAVLVGDYLFSKGLAYATGHGNFYAVDVATRTIETIVDGELLQMQHSRRRDTTRDIYFDIIDRKTAVLIAAAAQCGAQAMGATTQQVEDMRQFGMLVGRAFQVQDDILDFGMRHGALDDKSSGKMVLNDLRESKLTLPLIFVLENSTAHVRAKALRKLRDAEYDAKAVGWLRDFVFDNGGIQHSTQVMQDMVAQANVLLDGYDNAHHDGSIAMTVQALRDLTHYICHRSR